MADIKDEFDIFMQKKKADERFSDKEEFLLQKLNLALLLLQRANIYLHTWYRESHAGTGYGAKALHAEIERFISELESK